MFPWGPAPAPARPGYPALPPLFLITTLPISGCLGCSREGQKQSKASHRIVGATTGNETGPHSSIHQAAYLTKGFQQKLCSPHENQALGSYSEWEGWGDEGSLMFAPQLLCPLPQLPSVLLPTGWQSLFLSLLAHRALSYFSGVPGCGLWPWQTARPWDWALRTSVPSNNLITSPMARRDVGLLCPDPSSYQDQVELGMRRKKQYPSLSCLADYGKKIL